MSERPRVAVVVPQFLGGMPICGYHQARILHDRGFEVLYIRPRRPGGLIGPCLAESRPLAVRQVEFDTVPFFPGRPEARTPSRRGAAQIEDAIRSFAPEIVFFHDPDMLIPYVLIPVGEKRIAGLASARALGATCVAIGHTLTETYLEASDSPLIRPAFVKRFARRRWGELFNRNFRAVFTVNPDVVAYYRDLGVSLPVAAGAFNGVDLTVFAPPADPRAPGLRIVTVARLTREKGAHLLPEILRALRRREPEAELVVCGDGPLRVALQEAIGPMGGARFTGWLDPEGLAAELSSATLFLSTSVTETHGMAADEALACGTPVFVPDSLGFQRLRDAGVGRVYPASWLEPPGHEHLAEALVDRTAWSGWSAQALALRTHLGWEAAQDRLLEAVARELDVPALRP